VLDSYRSNQSLTAHVRTNLDVAPVARAMVPFPPTATAWALTAATKNAAASSGIVLQNGTKESEAPNRSSPPGKRVESGRAEQTAAPVSPIVVAVMRVNECCAVRCGACKLRQLRPTQSMHRRANNAPPIAPHITTGERAPGLGSPMSLASSGSIGPRESAAPASAFVPADQSIDAMPCRRPSVWIAHSLHSQKSQNSP
jgi:hypothetical protein